MALLDVAGAGGGGDVLEELAVRIAEHAVGNQRLKSGIARAAVEVEPAVVVEVAIVVPHGVANAIKLRLDSVTSVNVPSRLLW